MKRRRLALLLFMAGSIGSLCDGVIASRGLGVAELAALIMGRKNKSIVDNYEEAGAIFYERK